MKTTHLIALRLFLFVAAGAALVLAVHVVLFLAKPASPVKEFKEVLIPEGANFRAVASELADEGVITDREMFIVLARLKGVDRKVRAGFYSLNTGMRPLEVLEVIEKGRIIEYQVVLPEGFDMMKAAEAVEATGLATKAEFMAKAADPEYVRSLGLEGDTLEGYLFPATYFFPKGISTDGIIRQMVSKYREVFGEELKARAAELGMTEREALILASLVEREAAIDSERLLISAVFHNRLKRGMRLQCDSTIVYALQMREGWNGDITKADLRGRDPYNTYTHKGLPPGPIANPGKPSIIAALYPADVDYIFFVSRNDGTHYFSSNLAEHNRAVQQYQVLPNLTSAGKKDKG